MPEDISKYMKPPQAAAYLQVATSTLAKKRVYGDGPVAFRKHSQWIDVETDESLSETHG